jgi:hypothetical protein
MSRLAVAFMAAALLVAAADAHAVLTQPRARGALNTQRGVVPQVMDPKAPIDYCPHCLNCGGALVPATFDPINH